MVIAWGFSTPLGVLFIGWEKTVHCEERTWGARGENYITLLCKKNGAATPPGKRPGFLGRGGGLFLREKGGKVVLLVGLGCSDETDWVKGQDNTLLFCRDALVEYFCCEMLATGKRMVAKEKPGNVKNRRAISLVREETSGSETRREMNPDQTPSGSIKKL